MKLIINKIATEFNNILGGTKRVGDSRKLDGKRSYELDVKNAATLGNKLESTLNVNHSVYSNNSEKLRSVGADGEPDVQIINGETEPVYKTEQNLRVSNAQTLQDVQPINLEVDIARRLKVGTADTAPIITVESLIHDVAARRVQDSALLGGKAESTLIVQRATDTDNADLLNNTAQADLVVEESNFSHHLMNADGDLVKPEKLSVETAEFFRKGASTYDVWTYRDYVCASIEAKAIYVNVAASSNTLTTDTGTGTIGWTEILTYLKETTTSEVYKTTHLITDDTNNPVMTGAEVKNWIIGHAEFVAKVATLTSKVSNRAEKIGSQTTSLDLDGIKALIISSVADKCTLSLNSDKLENKTIAQIISRMRTEVLEVAAITEAEAIGFFGANQVKIQVKAIKVKNAENADTLGTYTYTQIKDQVKSEGGVLNSKKLYRDDTNVNAGFVGYEDITQDITDLKNILKGDAADTYNTLGKLEDFIIANKSSATSDLITESNTRITKDNALDDRIDASNTAIATEKGRIDTIVAITTDGDPDTFIKVKVVTDDILVRLDEVENESIVSLQNEINKTQSGAGLNDDGEYVKDTDRAYIANAESLKDADKRLDTAIVDTVNSVIALKGSASAGYDTLGEVETKITTNVDNINTEKARITQEITDRDNADTTLQGNIDTVDDTLTSEINNRTTAVSNEATTRSDADSTLQGNIDTVTNNLSTEVSDRESAISTEVTNRTNADTALDNKISDNTTAIDTEVTNRTDADTSLNNKISTNTTAIDDEVTARGNAVSSEASTRADADTALDNKISTNTTAIDDEVTARGNAVSSEASTRAANDGDLTTLTTGAKTSLVAAINEVDAHTDTKMEKLKELYFDDAINSSITANVSTRYYVDVTNGPITITLPEPTDNFDKILFHGLAGDFTTNNLTIDRAVDNTDTIMKSSEPLIVATNDETFTLVFVNNDWRIL